jgi:hypothetical protein
MEYRRTVGNERRTVGNERRTVGNERRTAVSETNFCMTEISLDSPGLGHRVGATLAQKLMATASYNGYPDVENLNFENSN